MITHSTETQGHGGYSRTMKKPKVLVILGQTATGKSALAVYLAKKLNGEIISADSRQVYLGLNIGSGKITKSEMQGVKHHLIDVVKPKNKFTVTDFQQKASVAITGVLKRDKLPIICGGTGFYIDAITKGIIFPEIPPDLKLRKILERKDLKSLLKILKKLDKARAENIDINNKFRLIRAIEIAKALGKVPKITEVKPMYSFIKIGLTLPKEKLKKKIEARVRGMFKTGLLKEIEGLKKAGVSSKRLREFGFEYNEPTYESVVSGNIKYAKRQMTWFKRDKNIKWFFSNQKKIILEYIKNKL